jgi:hypothetical protein
MNRRKAKEQEQTDAQAPDSQFGQSSASKRSKKGKKNAPEPKIELDLSTALPDSDSFRTSLMLGTFTARFSMLREQYDPNTKIGKASDDSVLFPKRASRLNLFNHNPLTDIAEVSSVRSSLIKPPFAWEDRTQSFGSDGYASDDGGSIMNRSKPGEGNNLFGGRQKLYRIPVGSSSVRTLPEVDISEREASAMSGRVVYQNDVSLSMFQQIREKEREAQRQREQHHRSDSSNNTEVDEIEAASSPSTAFSKDRGTNSSTTSGPLGRRTSTAATSVASEPRGSFAENRSATSLVTSKPIAEEVIPSERTSTVQRKLYGQTGEQSSPTHRAVRNVLEGSTRPRAPTYEKKPHALSPSKSASNLSGKYSRTGPFYPPVNFRTASPPPSSTPPGMVPMDLGLRESVPSGVSSGQVYGSLPPLSPPPSDGEDVLTYTNSVQPEDRGKATAMGLFNRPQKQYDELQFSQRQVQMHEGRISPLPQRQSPERRDDNASLFPRTESPEEGRYSPTNSSETLHAENRYAPADTGVSRPGYHESPRLPPNATSSLPSVAATFHAQHNQPKMSPGKVSRARARADSLKRYHNAELAALEAERKANRTVESSMHKNMVPLSIPAQNGTFLDNFSPSDDESDAPFESVQTFSRRPPSGVHPALRDGTIDFAFEPSAPFTNKTSETRTLANDETGRALWTEGMSHAISEPSPAPGDENDSSLTALTLGGGLGLSGMIRSHLRNDSDKSSIYPSASISQSHASALESPRIGTSARSQNQPESIHSNPWEFDDVHARTAHAEVPDETQDPNFMLSQRAKQIKGQATAFQTQAMTKAQQVLGDDAPLSAGDAPVGRSWQEEMRLRHQRDGSTETKQENQEFDNKLAEGRRMVQETIQSKMDNTNRPASPMRYPDRAANRPTNPLAALKHRTSKSSLKPRQPEHQTKAMKMLGITNSGMNEGSPDIPQEDQWAEEEQRMLREHARRKPRSPSTPLTGPRPPYNGAPRAASPRTSPYEDSERLRQRSITPTTAMYPRRDRAESTTSGRSKSRGGRPRDDIERAVIAGTGNYGGLYDKSNKTPSVISLPRPSLDGPDQDLYEHSSLTVSSGRQRSNSRPTAPGYFDNQSSIQGYSEPFPASELPPPLPIQAYSANSTPPLSSPALSSNVSTPTFPSHPSSHDSGLPPSFGHRSASTLSGRKKSVTKNMISDPTLLSSTSNIPAVSLPAPPNFRPHELASPPLPIMNPRRRRQTTTQNLFVSSGNNEKVDVRLTSMPESPNRPHHRFEERSTFSDEGEQRQPKQRTRLRKTSSEGGNMNLKARQQAMMASSPAMPRFPPGVGYSKPPPAHALNGGMF